MPNGIARPYPTTIVGVLAAIIALILGILMLIDAVAVTPHTIAFAIILLALGVLL